MRYFYRVGNQSTGLWYSKEGLFTGIIHTEFSWLTASQLRMPFDEQLVGYLSVADSLEHLYKWFSASEITTLQVKGYCIEEWMTTDYKFYAPYQHHVINKEASILNNKFLIIK